MTMNVRRDTSPTRGICSTNRDKLGSRLKVASALFNPTPMNVALYARVSTDRQAEKDLSIPAQLQAMHAYAAHRSWTVVSKFIEPGASARTAERPVLRALLRRCAEQPQIDVVLVHKIDRLARSVHDHAVIRLHLKKHRVKLASVAENVDDSVSGQLLENIMASIGEFYSSNLGEETKKGMRMKVEKGGWPHSPPRGYKVVRDETGKGHITIDETDAPAVRFAFEQYATNRFSFRRLRFLLAERGFRAKNGKPIPQSGMERILKNPFYAGRVRWGTAEYAGNHEALVPESQFLLVQKIILSRHEDHGEKGTLRFLLRGVAVCGDCGGKLTAERHDRWSYYRCIRRTIDKEQCPAKLSNASVAHGSLHALYRRLRLAPELRDRIRQSTDLQLAERAKERERRLSSLHMKRIKFEEREVRLAEAFAMGELSRMAYKAASSRLRSEIAAVHQAVQQVDTDPAKLKERIDTVLRVADSLEALDESFSEERQYDLVRAVFKRLVIRQGKIIDHQLRSPLDRLLTEAGPPPSSSHLDKKQVTATINTIFEVDVERFSGLLAA